VSAVYVCECGHMPGAHHGSTYACRTAGCRCVRFKPDIRRAAAEREDTLSTSARLALTEQRLAETERERDEAVGRCADLEQVREELAEARKLLDIFEADNQKLEGENAELVDKSLALKAELVSARQEIEQLRAARQWIVARDGGRYCERCEHEIRRGEAYELEPGTGGLIQHIHCPDLPLPDNQNGAPT
jgi:hypothetical protein